MANPFDIPYEVTAADAPLTYNRRCYAEGEIVQVNQNDIGCFLDDAFPDPELGCCFPEYCDTIEDPTSGYRVPVLVPAGGTIIQPVASIEGCKPPASVCFHYCGSCLYVGYDAAPVLDPADPVAATGGGADPNPTCRDLDCIETLHIHNPSDADLLVTLSYYC